MTLIIVILLLLGYVVIATGHATGSATVLIS